MLSLVEREFVYGRKMMMMRGERWWWDREAFVNHTQNAHHTPHTQKNTTNLFFFLPEEGFQVPSASGIQVLFSRVGGEPRLHKV